MQYNCAAVFLFWNLRKSSCLNQVFLLGLKAFCLYIFENYSVCTYTENRKIVFKIILIFDYFFANLNYLLYNLIRKK
ncbi:hypothetical protein FLACOL7796_04005 [Flavobacterium collinsii]|uniref:Secreted protein n=1 Tax=Flavobacterium collinsii TaxID=1114861 RepID=A0ABM8KNG2_9FLAO|nr:hypothetical protein FLACOL7796_04005 [Flavobacterium collinsii]